MIQLMKNKELDLEALTVKALAYLIESGKFMKLLTSQLSRDLNKAVAIESDEEGMVLQFVDFDISRTLQYKDMTARQVLRAIVPLLPSDVVVNKYKLGRALSKHAQSKKITNGATHYAIAGIKGGDEVFQRQSISKPIINTIEEEDVDRQMDDVFAKLRKKNKKKRKEDKAFEKELKEIGKKQKKNEELELRARLASDKKERKKK